MPRSISNTAELINPQRTAPNSIRYARTRRRPTLSMDEIIRKQQEHLRRVEKNRQKRMNAYGDGSDCAHLRCGQCVGTGVKENGTRCVHYISCPCIRCSPTYF